MLFALEHLPPEYFQVIELIDALRTRLAYATSDSRRRWTGLLRRSTFARNIRGSNSIEGYNVTLADAVAAVDGEEPLDAEKETWLAITGYRAALSHVLQLADDPYFAHNEGTIRALHYMMVAHDVSRHPGRWRPGAIYVKHEPTAETVYVGPDADLVPALMRELIESLNAKSDLPVMVRAALAHLNLVMIHPFSDGNGRMGRALQTLVLARERIVDPYFSSIEEYLGEHTPQYYGVLAETGKGAWHPENDPLPFVKFCLRAHFQQAEALLRRNEQLAAMWNLLEKELEARKLTERMIFALSDAAYGFRVTNSTYRALAEVSNEVASKDLRALVGSDLLVPRGEKRGRHYVAGERLQEAREKTRTPVSENDPFEIARRSTAEKLATET